MSRQHWKTCYSYGLVGLACMVQPSLSLMLQQDFTVVRYRTTVSSALRNSSCKFRLFATKTGLTGTASRLKRVSKLSDWSDKNKIKIGGVSIQDRDDLGLGLVATQDVQKGSVVTNVPTSVALTIETPSGGPDDFCVLDLCNDKRVFRELPWYVQFSLYLYKLDSISPTKGTGKERIDLQSWLDSLPRSFDTPIHWSKSGRDDWLQYKHLSDMVDRQTTSWEKQYKTLQSISTSDAAKMKWEDFLWGCECARSRAFSGAYTGSAFNPLVYAFTLLLVTAYVGLNLGTVEQAANGAALVFCASILRDFVVPKLFKTKKYVICPIIDMCNHKSIGTSAQVAFEFFSDSYSLASDMSVSKGNELFISYGARSNDQLLQYYGFVEQNNPHDVYVLPPLRNWNIGKLEEACGGPFASGRLGKLDRAGLLGKSAQGDDDDDDDESGNPFGGVVVTRAVGIDPAVIQALRALVSSEEEWIAAGEAVGNFADVVSADNERKARLAARSAIEQELESKPTTIEQDKELLKQMEGGMKMSAVSVEEKLAIQFRLEKKKLLQEAIDRLR